MHVGFSMLIYALQKSQPFIENQKDSGKDLKMQALTEEMEKIKQMMDSWLGCDISQVIQKWGPADKTADDEAGGKIYIWEKQMTKHVPEFRSEYPPVGGMLQSFPKRSTTYVPTNYTFQKMFYVREDGIIYHWRTDTQ